MPLKNLNSHMEGNSWKFNSDLESNEIYTSPHYEYQGLTISNEEMSKVLKSSFIIQYSFMD